jgi:Arc/MetJ-type ribon-helix-helix transcriptional regulator
MRKAKLKDGINVTVRLPKLVLEKIKAIAEDEFKSDPDVIREAILEYLKNRRE